MLIKESSWFYCWLCRWLLWPETSWVIDAVDKVVELAKSPSQKRLLREGHQANTIKNIYKNQGTSSNSIYFPPSKYTFLKTRLSAHSGWAQQKCCGIFKLQLVNLFGPSEQEIWNPGNKTLKTLPAHGVTSHSHIDCSRWMKGLQSCRGGCLGLQGGFHYTGITHGIERLASGQWGQTTSNWPRPRIESVTKEQYFDVQINTSLWSSHLQHGTSHCSLHILMDQI